MSRMLERQGCQWNQVKQIKPIFVSKEIVEYGSEHFFTILSSFNFFNKTDLKQVSSSLQSQNVDLKPQFYTWGHFYPFGFFRDKPL